MSYKVPVNSYAAFKRAVNGNGYDIDGHYGWQCWDGAALLWLQFGLNLLTGNGLAIGAWDLMRQVNKYGRFDLVTNVNNLKLGDVVCMRPNHIGFFDGFDGNYMRILGQNQGGRRGPNGGAAFNIVRLAKSSFAGAFRLKNWHTPPPKPAPAPSAGKYTVKKGDTLSAIAARYKMTWQQLYNHGRNRAIIGGNPNALKPGQVLDVPKAGKLTPTPPPKPKTHTVKKGDSLAAIAAKNGVTVTHLINWNKAKYPGLVRNASLIYPGWVLRVRP